MKLTAIEKQLERDVKTEFASFADSDNDGMVSGRHFDGIAIFIYTVMALFVLAAICAIIVHMRHSKEQRNPVSLKSVAPTIQSQ
jgi:hypothetical protein